MKTIRLTALFVVCCMMLTMLGGCSDKPTRAFGSQLEPPAVGEEIAVMHTNMGDIYIRFFPEEAPKAVENFKTLAKSGYYNGLVFYRVIDNFMIQSGDPTATGSGGESCWGHDFEDEFNAGLGNLRGALAMANAGPDTNGSQFFINQTPATATPFVEYRSIWTANEASLPYKTFAQYCAAQMNMDPKKLTDEIIEVYEKTGGNIHLDGPLNAEGKGHTVFGQVFKGMDVVDKIAFAQVDGAERPLVDMVIESIEFKKYEG